MRQRKRLFNFCSSWSTEVSMPTHDSVARSATQGSALLAGWFWARIAQKASGQVWHIYSSSLLEFYCRLLYVFRNVIYCLFVSLFAVCKFWKNFLVVCVLKNTVTTATDKDASSSNRRACKKNAMCLEKEYRVGSHTQYLTLKIAAREGSRLARSDPIVGCEGRCCSSNLARQSDGGEASPKVTKERVSVPC